MFKGCTFFPGMFCTGFESLRVGWGSVSFWPICLLSCLLKEEGKPIFFLKTMRIYFALWCLNALHNIFFNLWLISLIVSCNILER